LAFNEAVGGLKSSEIGAAYIEYIAGSHQESIAKNKEVKIGGDHNVDADSAMALTVGQDLKEEIDGRSQGEVKEPLAWLAKMFDVKTDKFSLIVGGKLILRAEKPGGIKWFGNSFTLDGSQITFKGGKIQKKAAGSLQNASVKLISRQQQDGHISGTPQNANRIKQGKSTSTFDGDAAEADALTQEAWSKGAPVPNRKGVKEYDFGRRVGTGPKGGGQTRVRVHEDSKGRIHGHPSGPEL
jgi:hypothetical protein